MRRLLERKTSFATQVPLGVRMRRVSQDYNEVQAFIEYWLDLGVDMVLVCRNVEQAPRSVATPAPACNYLKGLNTVVLVDGTMRVCDRRVPSPAWPIVEGLTETWRRMVEASAEGDLCGRCPQRYNGSGIVGTIAFRSKPDRVIHFKEDQFQQIYSLSDVREGVSWRRT
jgi:hypothetical protein